MWSVTAATGRANHFGRPLAVVKPRSVEEVSAVMRHCWQAGLRVVPQGGLTGLVGAAVAAATGEVVVSLERMNAVRQISPIDFAMVVEAGCILEDAKTAADAVDCCCRSPSAPRAPAASAATCRPMPRLQRAALRHDAGPGAGPGGGAGDGRIWNGLKVLRKDNRGYDLKQMFIGAEGTLGIITAAAFKLFPKPTRSRPRWSGWLRSRTRLELYARARRACSDLLTAFELILRDGIEVTLRNRPDFPDPLAEIYPAMS